MPLLIDTVIASLLHPRRANSPQRRLHEADLRNHVLALSFQTIAELYQWSEQSKWGQAKRAALAEFISPFARIPHDDRISRAWARIMTHSRNIGRRLDTADAWIAATAVRHRIALVTHDADLANLGFPGLTVICRSS